MSTHGTSGRETRAWLDDPRTERRVVWAVYLICAVLLLIDPLVHKHGYLSVQNWYGFYGLFAFVVAVGLVLAAGVVRRIVMRPEDYYDR